MKLCVDELKLRCCAGDAHFMLMPCCLGSREILEEIAYCVRQSTKHIALDNVILYHGASYKSMSDHDYSSFLRDFVIRHKVIIGHARRPNFTTSRSFERFLLGLFPEFFDTIEPSALLFFGLFL